MKLKYLGTAAAEALPAIFCNCEVCCTARERKGREIRTRSQAIVNDYILIDISCDSYFHSIREEIDFSKIEHCIITHVHGDHLYPRELYNLQPICAYNRSKMQIYGNTAVGSSLENVVKGTKGQLEFNKVNVFEPFYINDVKITALKAKHGSQEPYIYMFEEEHKSILYAHDTDIFPEATWEYLKGTGVVFDLVSLDCTEGAYDDLEYSGHMCLGRNIKCRNMMLEAGMANDNTKFVLNHFSHNGLNVNYKEFCELAEPHGFIVSFDGMVVEI